MTSLSKGEDARLSALSVNQVPLPFVKFLGVEAGDPDPEPETQASQHSGPLRGGRERQTQVSS